MKETTARRNTRQRQVILEELQKVRSHPSATTLYEIVRKRMPNISLGTVYRNLDLLARAGMIQKLNTGQNEAKYDGITDRHYHVCCAECGRVDDLVDVNVEFKDPGNGELQGFDILGHQLQFIGICPDCKGKQMH
jgi:Fur family ferric uptake transcriptional regulator